MFLDSAQEIVSLQVPPNRLNLLKRNKRRILSSTWYACEENLSVNKLRLPSSRIAGRKTSKGPSTPSWPTQSGTEQRFNKLYSETGASEIVITRISVERENPKSCVGALPCTLETSTRLIEKSPMATRWVAGDGWRSWKTFGFMMLKHLDHSGASFCVSLDTNIAELVTCWCMTDE